MKFSGEINLLNKKVILATFVLVILLFISSVNAAENITDDDLNNFFEDTVVTDNIEIETTDYVNNDNDNNLSNQQISAESPEKNLDKLNNREDVLSSSENENFISNTNDKEILGDSVPYTISISGDKTIKMGESGNIQVTFNYKTGMYGTEYDYNVCLDICDSSGNPKLSQYYQGTHNSYANLVLLYQVKTGSLNAGAYTAKLRDGNNYNKVLASYSFTVYYQLFSVSVPDNSIEYNSNGKISMSISPTSISPYEYDYYMKICDSNGVEIYSQQYSGTGQGTVSQYYPIYSGPKTSSATITTLAPGTYTIKIINTYDKSVLDTAKLVMKSETPSSASSVSVGDTSINYKSGGNVNIYISPVSGNYYKYDFYLKIYDSNNVEKISKRYNGECRGKDTLTYNIAPNTLSLGEYTLKVYNTTNNRLLDSAKLYMVDSGSSASYSIDIGDTIIRYWEGGSIAIKISRNSLYTSSINYYFQLSIYDSNNTLKISKAYYDSMTFDESSNSEYLFHYIRPNSLDTGMYTVKIIQNGNVVDTCKLYINYPTKLIASDLTTVYNGNKYLTVTLIDVDSGNGIEGASISVNLNGVKTITTNSKGQAKLSTNNLAPNTYSVSITFNGDSDYIKSTKNVKVIVNKATPKLTAKAKTFKKSVKTKKYSITLKTNQNKVMKNTKLTLKVKGKTYTAKTNSKGVATFKITKLNKKGTFKATITYKGSSYYNKVTKNVNIKIK